MMAYAMWLIDGLRFISSVCMALPPLVLLSSLSIIDCSEEWLDGWKRWASLAGLVFAGAVAVLFLVPDAETRKAIAAELEQNQ